MKIQFRSRLEAIDWIADYAKDEGQFEALREQLHYNFIYEGIYYIDAEEETGEIILLSTAQNR